MRSLTLVLALLFAWSPLRAATEAAPLHSSDIIGRSLLSEGDLTRLRATFAKAQRGEPVTLAFIGGSITEGAIASKPKQRYANLVTAWWERTFPKADFTFINAGIGATGSNYGSLRAQRDLLAYSPDFIVVDFGVNDQAGRERAESYEGLIRQVLKQPQRPATVLLFMTRNDGSNAQEWQAQIGQHYGLPMISYRDALWPEVAAGRLAWNTIGADYIHPNDVGHDYVAAFMIALLEKALAAAPVTPVVSPIKALPSMLFSDVFEHVTLLEAADLHPLNNQGWTYDPAAKAWVCKTPGSIIEFSVSGSRLFLMDYHLHGPMGKARVQVDNRQPITRDGWFDKTWGGYRDTITLGSDLPPGPHRIRVELLDDKNPESTGHEFRLFGLGAAGVASPAALITVVAQTPFCCFNNEPPPPHWQIAATVHPSAALPPGR